MLVTTRYQTNKNTVTAEIINNANIFYYYINIFLQEIYFYICKEYLADPVIVFAPICDKDAVNPFLPFSPYEAEPVPVPWIVGVASLDGLARSGGNIV